MMKRITGLAAVLTITGLVAGVAMADTEEPKFSVVQTYDGWELRRYEPTIEATVIVDGSFRTAVSAGFRMLAKYIFGDNRGPDGATSQKIAMTAPVSATPRRVAATGDASAWAVTFTMPSSFQMKTLPMPTDKRITIVQNPGGFYAAKRFAGKVKAPKDWQQSENDLRKALSVARLSDIAPPLTAQYNGPWVPGPFRRNEVLIPVKCTESSDPRCQVAP